MSEEKISINVKKIKKAMMGVKKKYRNEEAVGIIKDNDIIILLGRSGFILINNVVKREQNYTFFIPLKAIKHIIKNKIIDIDIIYNPITVDSAYNKISINNIVYDVPRWVYQITETTLDEVLDNYIYNSQSRLYSIIETGKDFRSTFKVAIKLMSKDIKLTITNKEVVLEREDDKNKGLKSFSTAIKTIDYKKDFSKTFYQKALYHYAVNNAKIKVCDNYLALYKDNYIVIYLAYRE